jgi:PsbN protein
MLKKKPFFWDYPIMEIATLVTIPISCLLVIFIGYALYTTFGQPSKELKDLFEEHEDEIHQ